MSRLYLTVDDAPSDGLPEKLAVLEEYEIAALFFCEGRRLAEYPAYARQAIEAGFHLGNHTYSHQYTSDLTGETFRDEITRTEALIDGLYDRAAVARPARLFRFPYGDRGGERIDRFQRVLEVGEFTPPDSERITYEWYDEQHAGTHDWFWTISVEDWTVDSRAELRARVESSADRLTHPSSDIVLFHDAGNTTRLFDYFIELLLDRGMEFGDPLDLCN